MSALRTVFRRRFVRRSIMGLFSGRPSTPQLRNRCPLDFVERCFTALGCLVSMSMHYRGSSSRWPPRLRLLCRNSAAKIAPPPSLNAEVPGEPRCTEHLPPAAKNAGDGAQTKRSSTLSHCHPLGHEAKPSPQSHVQIGTSPVPVRHWLPTQSRVPVHTSPMSNLLCPGAMSAIVTPVCPASGSGVTAISTTARCNLDPLFTPVSSTMPSS